jgi:hypothetical protein
MPVEVVEAITLAELLALVVQAAAAQAEQVVLPLLLELLIQAAVEAAAGLHLPLQERVGLVVLEL